MHKSRHNKKHSGILRLCLIKSVCTGSVWNLRTPSPAKLVQHCINNSEYSTCYLCHYHVVVSQQCHRIASFLRLVLTQISGTVFHCYLRNAVLVQHFLIPHTLSTRYLRHRRVVVSQQCHRIASFLRLALTKISSTKYMGIKKTLY